MPAEVEVEVAGRKLTLTNLDKVMYPEAGLTKAHVIDYLTRIAPVLLPHLRNRPLTLKRYPDGVEGEFFYEKECPAYRPPWVGTLPVWSDRKQANTNLCVVDSLPGLVWLGNLADLELHTYLHTADAPERPQFVAFDLDPGPPADVVDCCRVALRLKIVLDRLGLRAWPKTSGGKGLQVYVPLHTDATYDDTKGFARAMAELLERDDPSKVTSNMRKALRVGKVFVDWSQNDDHKTTVCAYSLRAKARPTVSTPVTWDEVETVARTGEKERLVFEHTDVLQRVEEQGDLFAPVLEVRQRLPRL